MDGLAVACIFLLGKYHDYFPANRDSPVGGTSHTVCRLAEITSDTLGFEGSAIVIRYLLFILMVCSAQAWIHCSCFLLDGNRGFLF
jgi:hypothetical protein